MEPAMNREELKASIEKLLQALQNDPPVDHETQELIRRLSTETHEILEQQADMVLLDEIVANQQQDPSVIDKLMSMTKDFEGSHPKLAEFIGNLATALSRIGI